MVLMSNKLLYMFCFTKLFVHFPHLKNKKEIKIIKNVILKYHVSKSNPIFYFKIK